MKKLIWKIRFVINIRRRAGLPLLMAWGVADTSWFENLDLPCSPKEAVDEELSCWGE